jgi:hypothetical protein
MMPPPTPSFGGKESDDGLVPEPFDVAEFRAFILQKVARSKPVLKETGFAAR